MTQRDPNFKGGIQPGTTASSAASISLEKALRDAVVLVKAKRPDLRYSSGFSASQLCEALGGSDLVSPVGTRPDGGMFFSEDGQLLVAAEAKKQGGHGNAIERWFKNWLVCRTLGVKRYVTFCAGTGFFEGRSAQATLQTAVLLEEPTKAVDGSIWNVPVGRLWMYRFQAESVPSPQSVAKVLLAAIAQAEAEFAAE